jgi:hypothetical protein
MRVQLFDAGAEGGANARAGPGGDGGAPAAQQAGERLFEARPGATFLSVAVSPSGVAQEPSTRCGMLCSLPTCCLGDLEPVNRRGV